MGKMANVKMEIKDKHLLIDIDLTKEHGLSSTGKSMMIATTSGNVPLPEPYDSMKLGLNLMKPNR
jgi:hypothetical protein